MQGDDTGEESGRVLGSEGVPEAGEDQGLAPLASEGDGAGADNGRYVEMTTALAGATTWIGIPFPFDIDPAGLPGSKRPRNTEAAPCRESARGRLVPRVGCGLPSGPPAPGRQPRPGRALPCLGGSRGPGRCCARQARTRHLPGLQVSTRRRTCGPGGAARGPARRPRWQKRRRAPPARGPGHDGGGCVAASGRDGAYGGT